MGDRFANMSYLCFVAFSSSCLKEVGLESRLERGENGSLTQKAWEGVPDGWAVGRKTAGAEGGEFGARGV